MEESFKYEYSAPTIEEKKLIKSIKEQYMPKDNNQKKIDLLKSLDNKVKSIPMIFGLSFGVIGVLLFGTGLTFFLEWTDLFVIGIPFSLIGTILMLLAYPIYKKVLNNFKNKYGKQIIDLSNELLNESE